MTAPGPTKHFHHLSKRQQAMIRFVTAFTRTHGYPPTMREVGQATGISSTCVVAYNITRLVQWGYLAMTPRTPRSLRVLIPAPSRARRTKGGALSIHLELTGQSDETLRQAGAARAEIDTFIRGR